MINAMSNNARQSRQIKSRGEPFDEASAEVVLEALKARDEQIQGFSSSTIKSINELKDRLMEVEQKAARRPGAGGTGSSGVSTLSSAFTTSSQFQALKSGAPSTGRVTIDRVSIKSITNAGQGITGSTDYAAQVQRQPGLFNDPRRKLSLLDVLPSLAVSGSVFEYMMMGDYTNAAAEQEQEGAQKAEASIEATPEQAQIATVAHWVKASKQVLDDTPALAQQIGNLMSYGLLARLEALLIGGVGGKGKIKGLTGYATPYPVAGTLKPADAIGRAITALNDNGWSAGLVIMNAADWFAIASERDADGRYVIGSPSNPAPPSLWNVPVITSPSIAVGKALVLDPAQTAVLDREQPSLMASREDGANFTSNLVTILAELRSGLAVFSTGAVLSVSIAAS